MIFKAEDAQLHLIHRDARWMSELRDRGHDSSFNKLTSRNGGMIGPYLKIRILNFICVTEVILAEYHKAKEKGHNLPLYENSNA